MSEDLFSAIGDIDDELLEEAYTFKAKKAPIKFVGRVSRIACIIILAAGVVTVSNHMQDGKKQIETVTEDVQTEKQSGKASQFAVIEEKGEAVKKENENFSHNEPEEYTLEKEPDEEKSNNTVTQKENEAFVTEKTADIPEVNNEAVTKGDSGSSVPSTALLQEAARDSAKTDGVISGGGGGGSSGGVAAGNPVSDYIHKVYAEIKAAHNRGELPFVTKIELSANGKISVTVVTYGEDVINRICAFDKAGNNIIIIKE